MSPAAYSDGLVRPDERTSAGSGSGSAWLRPEGDTEGSSEGDADGNRERDAERDAGRGEALRSPGANGTVWCTIPASSAPSGTCRMPPTACTRHGCST